MPERVQMSRQRPWRAEHPDAVIVARPSEFGNVFHAYRHCKGRGGDWGVEDILDGRSVGHGWTRRGALQFAVGAYRAWVEEHPAFIETIRLNLAGRDLACWCPLDEPCHADVLLELANREVA